MPPFRRPLRLLHTADVHLDSDSYGGAGHREHERGVLQRIVDRALDDAVDLMLIAGDLFDHARASDETVAFVRAELARLRQPVVILPSNHDALYPGSLYDRHDFTAGASHVHVIHRRDGQMLEFPGLDTVVWGRAMDEHVPAFQPLAHIPPRDAGRWCLAMAHGFFYPERQRPERSSPIFADEVRATGWDYVALGHHHLRADVSQGDVTAWYAGAPVEEGADGRPGGSVLRIDLSAEDGVRVQARPLF
jgi:exonuclease SbcD